MYLHYCSMLFSLQSFGKDLGERASSLLQIDDSPSSVKSGGLRVSLSIWEHEKVQRCTPAFGCTLAFVASIVLGSRDLSAVEHDRGSSGDATIRGSCRML